MGLVSSLKSEHTQHLQKSVSQAPDDLKRKREDDSTITLNARLIAFITEHEPVKSQDAYTKQCIENTLKFMIEDSESIEIEAEGLAEIVLEYCR